MKIFYVYILANKRNGFLYIGLTSDLPKRVWEHKNGVVKGHTQKYSIKRLVYYEVFDNFEAAEQREKRLKRWRRAWKDELIETTNPDWNDLYKEVVK
ncbi:MAG: GIY-YIG nuclease family protein [Rhodospirillales bacterium]|nr:GIY-YIG nuclease family protein [Rhodospirillales bacterium]MCB9995012.1 GIY-YIG nuclease family protein [Rhodospirillales bacterium]